MFGESNWDNPEGVTPHAAGFLGYDMQNKGTDIEVEDFNRDWNLHDKKPKDTVPKDRLLELKFSFTKFEEEVVFVVESRGKTCQKQ